MNTNFSNELFGRLNDISLALGPSFELICLFVAALVTIYFFFHKNYWKASFLAIVVVGSFIVVRLVYGLVVTLGGEIPDVQNTVGNASFYGIEKESEMRAYWFTVIALIIFVLASSSCWKFLENKFNFPNNDKKTGESESKFSFLFFGFLVISISMLIFPDLSALDSWGGPVINTNKFDRLNTTTWAYFRHLGLVPFKDFWYPYSGFFYTTSPFPPDIIFLWFHKMLLFVVTFFSVYVLLDFSKVRTLSILFFMFWMFQLGFFESPVFQKEIFRYFLSVSIVLFYAASINSKKILSFFLLGTYMAYIFFMVPVQLIYAAPSCILILIVSLILSKDSYERMQHLKHAIIINVSATTLMFLYMIYLSSQGALKEYFMFYKTVGDLANSSMISAGMYLETVRNNDLMLFGFDVLFVVLMFCLMILSLWNVCTSNTKLLKVSDFVPFAFAIIVILAYQKLIIRPWFVAFELMALPSTGLALLLAKNNFMQLRGGTFTKGFLLLIAGTLFYFLVIASGVAEKMWDKDISKILNLPHNIRLALKGSQHWEEVENSRYLPSSFTIDNASGSDLRAQFLKKMQFEKEDDLFVLGDDSYLYIILEKQAPFYICLYSQSILYSQQNTVDWLKKHRPKYVVWKSSFKEFDGVPNIVRVPLIFEYVIDNYTYESSEGGFIILKKKDPLVAVDTDFWMYQLGNTVSLGFIPSRSDPDRFKTGNDNSKNNYTILTIDNPKPIHGKERTILFKHKNSFFKIKYKEQKNVYSYDIILERIWFWRFIEENPDFKIPELTGHIRKIGLSKTILY